MSGDRNECQASDAVRRPVHRDRLDARLEPTPGTHAWNQYVVEYTRAEGADIQTLAGQYDVSIEQILVSNGLQTDEITVGTVI
jgi:LysM repeat protein